MQQQYQQQQQSPKKLPNQSQLIKKKNILLSNNSVILAKGNNPELIKQYFENYQSKWKILENTPISFTRYHLKWVNNPSQIDYSLFTEGVQIANHIQNIKIIGTKSGLMNLLQNDKHLLQYLPESYLLNIENSNLSQSEQNFIAKPLKGVYILKPGNNSCGAGIQLIKNIYSVQKDFQKVKENLQFSKPTATLSSQYFSKLKGEIILQKYIENPLLINNRKFDLRCYVLIACSQPFLVLFHHGYIRISLNEFSLDTDNNKSQKDLKQEQLTHLTNAAIQKNHPDYEQKKEQSIWSMMQFEKYLIKNNIVKSGADLDNIYGKIKEMLTKTIQKAIPSLDRKIGCFELLGCDIMIDDKLNPYLIEMNFNPSLDTNCQAQKQIIPHVINTSLNLVLFLNENQILLKNSVQNIEYKTNLLQSFQILINEPLKYYFKHK